MKKTIFLYAILVALTGACATQTTKEYVDKRDAANLVDSKDYTDVKVSELERKFPTTATLKPMVDEIVASNIYPWAREVNKPKYTPEEIGALPSTTFIPYKVSDIRNDLDFVSRNDSIRASSVGTADTWTDATGVVWRAVFDPIKDHWTIKSIGGLATPEYVEGMNMSVIWDGSNWVLKYDSGGSTKYFTTTYGIDTYSFILYLPYPENEVLIEAVRHPGGSPEAVDRVSYASGVDAALTNLAGAVNYKADKTNVYTRAEVDAKGYVTARETNTELRIFHGDAFSSMRVEPPKSNHTLPVNQWRALELGDEKTVAKTRYHETDKLLVGSPRDLYFIDRVEIDGTTTNYVLKSFQSYLDAVSPLAVGDLIGQYLPTNGGGTVTGEVKVLGNLYVSGEVSMPNLVDVRTANIIANGFVVSNRVVVAESGLMVSNGVCHINGAIANGTVQATRVHIMDGGDVTFGGSPENPTAGMRGMIEGVTLEKLSELGFNSNSNTLTSIGSTEGTFVEGTIDGFARLTDIVSHASPNCVRPVNDRVNTGGTHASITLRNWCLNVPTESIDVTKELRVFYPFHEIKDHFDMTQRLSFGIYFPTAPAATVSVKWDYAPDDGGFELRGETGDELGSVSAGDYIWFQQIGTNVLSVTKRNVSNTIHPLVNE